MEPVDWGHLHEELQLLVLARLPLIAILKLRLVCKQWNKVLASDEMNRLHKQVKARLICRPWFVFLAASVRAVNTPWKNSTFVCFNPDDFKWRRLPLHLDGLTKIGVFIASQGNVLLCLARNMQHLNDDSKLWICNPFSGKKKLIPQPPNCFCLGSPDQFQTVSEGDPPELFQALVLDRATNRFGILVEGYYKTVDVYDSSTNIWTPTRMRLPPHIELNVAHAICNGNLYCIAKHPSRVVAYNMEENIWIDPVVLISPSIHRAHLVESHNELLMIGAIRSRRIERDRDSTLVKLCIWKLSLERNTWDEIVVMPPALQEEFLNKHNYDNFYVVGQGDFVYLTSVPKASDKKVNEPLFYSFAQKSWHWTPACDLRHRCSGSIASPIWRSFYNMPNMYTFEPSLLDVPI